MPVHCIDDYLHGSNRSDLGLHIAVKRFMCQSFECKATMNLSQGRALSTDSKWPGGPQTESTDSHAERRTYL